MSDHAAPRSVLEVADDALEAWHPSLLRALDFGSALADGIPDATYVAPPWIPAAMVTWAVGASETGKSIWAAWIAAELTRTGHTVVVVSQENPLAVDVDRYARLRPDFGRLSLFHDQGLDLADPSYLAELTLASAGADLVIIDTLTGCWSGDENDNSAIAALDRDRLRPLVQRTQAAVLMVHHVGHAQPFAHRNGIGAARGASAIGQKADVILTFRTTGDRTFELAMAKNRAPGGHKPPPTILTIRDTDDGGLDIAPIADAPPAALSGTQERVLASLGTDDGRNAATYREIGDRLAADQQGPALKRSTIQKALEELGKRGLVDVVRPGKGLASRWWRT